MGIHMWKDLYIVLLWYYNKKNWISAPWYKYSYKMLKENFDTKLCLRRYPALIFLKTYECHKCASRLSGKFDKFEYVYTRRKRVIMM